MELQTKDLPVEKKHLLLFMMLVQQHEKIALIQLAEMPNPAHNQLELDLKAAKFAIETLEMLNAYTQNSISNEAKEYLSTILNKLNSIYTEKSSNA